MKTQSSNGLQSAKKRKMTPDEDDFTALDAWAMNLQLEDGRPLTPAERREERVAQKRRAPSEARIGQGQARDDQHDPKLDQGGGPLRKADGTYAVRPDSGKSGRKDPPQSIMSFLLSCEMSRSPLGVRAFGPRLRAQLVLTRRSAYSGTVILCNPRRRCLSPVSRTSFIPTLAWPLSKFSSITVGGWNFQKRKRAAASLL